MVQSSYWFNFCWSKPWNHLADLTLPIIPPRQKDPRIEKRAFRKCAYHQSFKYQIFPFGLHKLPSTRIVPTRRGWMNITWCPRHKIHKTHMCMTILFCKPFVLHTSWRFLKFCLNFASRLSGYLTQLGGKGGGGRGFVEDVVNLLKFLGFVEESEKLRRQRLK